MGREMEWVCQENGVWKNGNINKERKSKEKPKKEILELKSTLAKMKNSLRGVQNKFEQAEESVHLRIG